MAASKQPKRVEAKIDQTARLLFMGASVLDAMLRDGDAEGTVRFKGWASSLRALPELDSELTTNDRLVWLWESLRSAPDLRDQFGDLPAATVPWTSRDQRFEVFDPGEWFVIGMKGGEVAQLLQRATVPSVEERVCVQTKAKLRMRPGKGDRLECCDCRAEVTIHVEKVFSVKREADIIRIDEDRIELADGLVKVQVNSLNQAYTVSSCRLEPERRSHGGRTYVHVVHARNGKRTRLEDVRQLVESGCWTVPGRVDDSTPHISSKSLVREQRGTRNLFD